MSWIKKLFKQKEKVEVAVEPEIDPNRDIRGLCPNCKKPVEMEDKWTKQLGQYYHRKCWKFMVKQSW